MNEAHGTVRCLGEGEAVWSSMREGPPGSVAQPWLELAPYPLVARHMEQALFEEESSCLSWPSLCSRLPGAIRLCMTAGSLEGEVFVHPCGIDDHFGVMSLMRGVLHA